MRLLVGDIDDLAVTPADLSDLWFEGSPTAISLLSGGGAERVTPVRSASLDRPSGSLSSDSRYDLSGLLEPPCDAKVAWDSGRATLHAVSYHYCSLADVLDFGDEKRQSPKQLGRTELDAFTARNRAERVCETICWRTFRAEWRSEGAWDGPSLAHQLEWPATRLLTPGWSLVGDGLARRSGRPSWDAPVVCEPPSIEYVTGDDSGCPPDVRWAVARLAASYLMLSKVPERAVSESTDVGMTRYTLANTESTGIPDIDAVLSRYARKRWAVL